MSFLAGRLAATEGAYFLQESKHAVGRIVQNQKTKSRLPSTPQSPIEYEAHADVLPEVLRHSLPSKIFQPPPDSSLSTASKWVLQSDPNNMSLVSRDALNPLRAYVSLPQVTFGPRRWQLPNTDNSFSASTANDLRHDKYIPVNPEKLKAAAVGLSQIAKAFAVATAVVFGGSTLMFGLAVSKLELHSSDDFKTKGKDLVQPKLEMVKEQFTPLKNWAGDMSKKWHLEREDDIKEKPLIKELSKILGAKTPN
ncbi:Ribosomal RNA small subunit methyltransferase [Actinidia chinensis var. chinensis]|uniref:Ribosomal RNA small subunit methyltransferase n=1 Tax=Actinidia chinensis var. chinensis TaxID=1590841 RepID=A0A2R6QWL1_ACTCC|nr:Ribosomal RNA small subunit methyltransferase [Actinidia chinensis var. chinensis]